MSMDFLKACSVALILIAPYQSSTAQEQGSNSGGTSMEEKSDLAFEEHEQVAPPSPWDFLPPRSPGRSGNWGGLDLSHAHL